MSRLLVAAFLILVAAPATPAAAAPRTSDPLGQAVTAVGATIEPTTVCTVRDDRLSEISGMIVTRKGYVVIDDSSDDAARRKIFFLNKSCKVSRTVPYPSRPRDTEDMAGAPDGTLWIADIGDNDRNRDTIGLWKLAPDAKSPVLHRLRYPDGPHDAEALLLNGDGTPIIVTKDPGTADIYTPAAPLRDGGTVELKRAGQFSIPSTHTSNPYSVFGRALITGAANSPDGGRAVLRTYADAFEVDVTGGDVVAALTTGKPRAIALPDEPQGESIAYGAGGAALLTVSESAGQPAGTKPTILRYELPTVSTARATQRAPAPASKGADTPAVSATAPVLVSSRIAGVTFPVLAIAASGMLLAVIGLFGFYRSRRANR